jgi:hypothetical protein
MLALQALAVEPCANMTYEDINQPGYGPLPLSRLVGQAVDPSGVAVPGVCVGLFTKSEHRLVMATATLANGEFTLKTPPRGVYRLVGQLPPFGVANARMRVGRGAVNVILRLRPRGLDTTSYFESK